MEFKWYPEHSISIRLTVCSRCFSCQSGDTDAQLCTGVYGYELAYTFIWNLNAHLLNRITSHWLHRLQMWICRNGNLSRFDNDQVIIRIILFIKRPNCRLDCTQSDCRAVFKSARYTTQHKVIFLKLMYFNYTRQIFEFSHGSHTHTHTSIRWIIIMVFALADQVSAE